MRGFRECFFLILELLPRVEFSCLKIGIYEAIPDAIGYLRHFYETTKHATKVSEHLRCTLRPSKIPLSSKMVHWMAIFKKVNFISKVDMVN